jgi:small-conductance mechanosensitive channel
MYYVPLQFQFVDTIEQTLQDVVGFLPQLIGALLVLLVGWIIGRFVYGVISRVVDRVELDRYVMKTPLGRVLGDSERAVSRSFGRLGAWFVYALALLAAANVLAIDLLSEWIATAVSYFPAFIVGTLIIVVGFVLADVLADIIARTESVTETGYTDVFADGIRVFLYFIAIVIGLDTIGVDVEILYTFATAAAWGLAAGIALAIGIAFGWGGKDYVSQNIDNWAPFGRTGGEGGAYTTSQPGDDS